MEFFQHLEPLLRIFWFIAIPASIVFLIQSIMTFTGMDASDGNAADFDSNLTETDAPFQLFTFRNLIHFLLGFGWTGIAFYHIISGKSLLIILSFLVGAGFVAMFFFIIKQIQRLAEDNTFKIKNALNKTGEVYLTIPADKSGKGKVQVSINGSYFELEAVTEQDKIETGALVRITRIASNNIVVVEKI